jgi:hypothetical protein
MIMLCTWVLIGIEFRGTITDCIITKENVFTLVGYCLNYISSKKYNEKFASSLTVCFYANACTVCVCFASTANT